MDSSEIKCILTMTQMYSYNAWSGIGIGTSGHGLAGMVVLG